MRKHKNKLKNFLSFCKKKENGSRVFLFPFSYAENLESIYFCLEWKERCGRSV